MTGEAATKAQAAAVKSVGSGTAGAVTTDFTGHGYETTVTKSDGSKVEVHLDSSFNVMQVPGWPRWSGRRGRPGRPAPGGRRSLTSREARDTWTCEGPLRRALGVLAYFSSRDSRRSLSTRPSVWSVGQ